MSFTAWIKPSVRYNLVQCFFTQMSTFRNTSEQVKEMKALEVGLKNVFLASSPSHVNGCDPMCWYPGTVIWGGLELDGQRRITRHLPRQFCLCKQGSAALWNKSQTQPGKCFSSPASGRKFAATSLALTHPNTCNHSIANLSEMTHNKTCTRETRVLPVFFAHLPASWGCLAIPGHFKSH